LKEVFSCIPDEHDDEEPTVLTVIRTIREVTAFYETYADIVHPELQFLFKIPLQARLQCSHSILWIWLNSWRPVLERLYPTPAEFRKCTKDHADMPYKVKATTPEDPAATTPASTTTTPTSTLISNKAVCLVPQGRGPKGNNKNLKAGNSKTKNPMVVETKAHHSDEVISPSNSADAVLRKDPADKSNNTALSDISKMDRAERQTNHDKTLTSDSSTDHQAGKAELRSKKPKVSFAWREATYDEAGNCRIEYSKWSERSRSFRLETPSGYRLDGAQIKSHQKFKIARAAQRALLQTVDEEYRRQCIKRTPTDHPKLKQHTLPDKIITKSARPCNLPQKSPPREPSIISTTTHPVEVLLPLRLRFPRIQPVKTTSTFNKNSKSQQATHTTHKITTEHSSQTKALPTYLWIQQARGIRALTPKSSYLLPLPWQHHAWTAPAHRKTLCQQPFMT
jgi:hypothetical protein